LTYPDRNQACLEPLDFGKLNRLTFEEPDLERFPCLGLAYTALRAGGTMPAVLNAANEIAVQAFLDGKIRLTDIAIVNEGLMNEHSSLAAGSLDAVLSADEWARSRAIMRIERSAAAV
jgi:1-deoxy-D-xylulose-5-phosphate reductoisomerase